MLMASAFACGSSMEIKQTDTVDQLRITYIHLLCTVHLNLPAGFLSLLLPRLLRDNRDNQGESGMLPLLGAGRQRFRGRAMTCPWSRCSDSGAGLKPLTNGRGGVKDKDAEEVEVGNRQARLCSAS